MSYNSYADLDWFVGKVIKSISLNKAKDVIDFVFEGGVSKRLTSEGDCCSHSWIEHLEMPNDMAGGMAGATILSVDEADMPPWDNHVCGIVTCTHDHLAVYHTTFHTDMGAIVLEYRNDSNGYYGGWLDDCGAVPAAGD